MKFVQAKISRYIFDMKDYSHIDFYQILGISRESDFQEIKKAYYRCAKNCHPDLHGGSAEKEEEFKRIVLAFDILSDPDKRKIYDFQRAKISEKETILPGFESSEFSIMDSEADDTLEELIVGNEVPEHSTLATLFLDLEKTEIFMKFREAKNYYRQKQFYDAMIILKTLSTRAPTNILYRYYLARVYASLGKYYLAEKEYLEGIEIGNKRIPPQKLIKFHNELKVVRRKRHPFIDSLITFFSAKRDEKLFFDSQSDMISEMNRAIGNISKEIEKKKKEKEKENRMLSE